MSLEVIFVLGLFFAGYSMALWGAYKHPRTQPYVKKYGLYLALPLAAALGIILLAVRPSRGPAGEERGAQKASNDSREAMSVLIAEMEAGVESADAELSLRRLEAQASSASARTEVRIVQDEIDAAMQISDAYQRRAMLIEINRKLS